MSKVREAFEAFLSDLKKVPRERACDFLHSQWSEVAKQDYYLPTKAYLVPSHLTDFWKFLILYGRERKQWSHFDLSRPLNQYKRFWSLAEAENKYTDQPEFLTVFVFRLLCQQHSFLISRQRVAHFFRQTRAIYLETTMDLASTAFNPIGAFEKHFGLKLEDFLLLAESTYQVFRQHARADMRDFASQSPTEIKGALRPALELLTANERRYRELYQSTSPAELNERPYEFNPGLRYPIFRSGPDYWCPFPELIVYAATKGLLFLLSDTFGSKFSRAFGDLFADYARRLTSSSLKTATVISEAEERQLGFLGKTNDFTVIADGKAALFECKTSALFSSAKRHATIQEIETDIRKNLVNPEKRKGLIQLYEKYRAINGRELPPLIASKYENVRQIFPVLLLYDHVQQANGPQTLRNLLLRELKRAEIPEFPFQIWHIEELENLFELCGQDGFWDVVSEKFDTEKYRFCDLNTLLFERTGKNYLRAFGFLPGGNTPATRILKELADQHSLILRASAS